MVVRIRVMVPCVEINGTVRREGDELEESDFRPKSGRLVDDGYGGTMEELSEADSLLRTGHIAYVVDYP